MRILPRVIDYVDKIGFIPFVFNENGYQIEYTFFDVILLGEIMIDIDAVLKDLVE